MGGKATRDLWPRGRRHRGGGRRQQRRGEASRWGLEAAAGWVLRVALGQDDTGDASTV
jgi:hypothetical protein